MRVEMAYVDEKQLAEIRQHCAGIVLYAEACSKAGPYLAGQHHVLEGIVNALLNCLKAAPVDDDVPVTAIIEKFVWDGRKR